MKTIIALALALGIVSAVVVYAVATWQVQNAGPPPAARFAAALARDHRRRSCGRRRGRRRGVHLDRQAVTAGLATAR